jgi:hypothetical protein
LERARKIREELAALESGGRGGEDGPGSPVGGRRRDDEIRARAAAERAEDRERRRSASAAAARYLAPPETPEEQVRQAVGAVERAFASGVTRQIVRFALVPVGETLNQEDRLWPGGARQMYREAAKPMTVSLLKQVRAPTIASTIDAAGFTRPPAVTAQDVWDFDGSALVTAQAATGPADDVQALVQPNTDDRYTTDIAAIDGAMKQRLFLLVNPFWRDASSWSFNLLQPGGKKKAQAVIFDRCDFQETYAVLQKSVRGEDCVAVKAYPHDWQLYAYTESNTWPHEEYSIHLGSTKQEPSSKDFAALLAEREEFKMNKNMRAMQRMMNNKDE